ncbi:MAG TPA: PepSY-associated TM helix domain-containing protein, partial [Vicinamibacterales bacterium]|nr:PepSY-associated TM helix domain-containing protein [Vicinamibacterales bacterium]
MNIWTRWVRQPQTLWLRKAVFQVHLWTGVGVGFYTLLISLTGSVLVYRNELYRAATPKPVMVRPSGARLSEDGLKAAAAHAYPEYAVFSISHESSPNEAVTIALRRGNEYKSRLFDPYTGADLGDAVPLGILLVSRLLSLHDDLFAGSTGRSVNGIAALTLIVMASTGLVVWWPGIGSWRRSLVVRRHVGWRRLAWDLHSAIGFWTFFVILMFGISGAYLGNPETFQDFADRLQPPTAANAGFRLVDSIIYWLAYLHFGRICGIGIPCKGP